MGPRRVFKWKHRKGPSGKTVRIVRCSMAPRGFRDTGARALETFGGAAKRASQRVLSPEAARRPGWVHVAVDVVKAFLQGMACAEMQEQGEAPREVNCSRFANPHQPIQKQPL